MLTRVLSVYKTLHNYVCGASRNGYVSHRLYKKPCEPVVGDTIGRWIKEHSVYQGDLASISFQALRNNLRSNVYGQHLVHDVVLSSLEGHTIRQPEKPLVLSFHGSTGTGKNYVSQWIAQSWFKEGLNSKYVHLFSATKDFPFKSEFVKYKEYLQNTVVSKTKECKHQIFIFDEVDSFPPALLNYLSTFLDHHPRVDGVDYRNTIFLFLSNTGDEVLRQVTGEFYQNGSRREDIKLNETEPKMIASIFSAEDMGLSRSHLIKRYLVSHYVPFLPLERKHVRQCILREIQTEKSFYGSGDVDDIIEEVIAQLQFGDGAEHNFSVKGCKNVAEKLNFVMMSRRPSKQEL